LKRSPRGRVESHFHDNQLNTRQLSTTNTRDKFEHDMQRNHKKIRRITLKLSRKTIHHEATELLCSNRLELAESIIGRHIAARSGGRPRNLADCVFFPRNDRHFGAVWCRLGPVVPRNRHQWHRYLSSFNLICVFNDRHACAIWRSLDQRWPCTPSRSSNQSTSTSCKSILVDYLSLIEKSGNLDKCSAHCLNTGSEFWVKNSAVWTELGHEIGRIGVNAGMFFTDAVDRKWRLPSRFRSEKVVYARRPVEFWFDLQLV
jgi:hypothetical protein